MKRLRSAFCCLLLLLTLPCGAQENRPVKVSLMYHWIPQAQFAGYIVALEKGFYGEAGLDVVLVPGGPAKSAFDSLASGEVNFCTGWLANGIAERATGSKLVNVAQIFRRSSLMLVARRDAGIQRPQDLDGKRVGVWTNQFHLQAMALFRKFGVSVKVVPNYSSVNLFLKRGVDAMLAMWYNEYHTLLNSGLDPEELTVFFFSDSGLNFPEDGLYCMEQTVNNSPDICTRLVQASIRGWVYALENQDEALNLVMKHADMVHTGTNKAHQRWMLARMRDLIMPEDNKTGLGRLAPSEYEAVGRLLQKSGAIEHLPEIDAFYRGPR